MFPSSRSESESAEASEEDNDGKGENDDVEAPVDVIEVLKYGDNIADVSVRGGGRRGDWGGMILIISEGVVL